MSRTSGGTHSSPTFPTNDRDLIDQGRRFAHVSHGAPILYNLMLAEQIDNQELVEKYDAMLQGVD